MGFADESPDLSNPNCQKLLEYREGIFDYGYAHNDSIWASLKPYPRVEFGTLVEKLQDCVTSCIVHETLEVNWRQRGIVKGQYQTRKSGHGERVDVSRVDVGWNHLLRSLYYCVEALLSSSFWVLFDCVGRREVGGGIETDIEVEDRILQLGQRTLRI